MDRSKLRELRERATFSHYAKKPISVVRCVKQDRQPDMKPRGFWFSVDDPTSDSPTWASWCESENFDIGSLRHVVELAPAARIHLITSARELDAFHLRYRAAFAGLRRTYINWTSVAGDHQGIIIAPYLWERRLEGGADWYYSWDCASGCIWDAAAISTIALSTVAALEQSEAADG